MLAVELVIAMPVLAMGSRVFLAFMREENQNG